MRGKRGGCFCVWLTIQKIFQHVRMKKKFNFTATWGRFLDVGVCRSVNSISCVCTQVAVCLKSDMRFLFLDFSPK